MERGKNVGLKDFAIFDFVATGGIHVSQTHDCLVLTVCNYPTNFTTDTTHEVVGLSH